MKCLQFVSVLVIIIVLIGKGQVPTDGSHKETAQTQVFSFLVSISVSVAKGKVQRASLSLGGRTHTLDMFFSCLVPCLSCKGKGANGWFLTRRAHKHTGVDLRAGN